MISRERLQKLEEKQQQLLDEIDALGRRVQSLLDSLVSGSKPEQSQSSRQANN